MPVITNRMLVRPAVPLPVPVTMWIRRHLLHRQNAFRAAINRIPAQWRAFSLTPDTMSLALAPRHKRLVPPARHPLRERVLAPHSILSRLPLLPPNLPPPMAQAGTTPMLR